MNPLLLAVLALSLLGTAAFSAEDAPRVLAEGGKSAYAIHYNADAPKSVKRAGAELQRVIEKATGVKLPISTTPVSPAISLGTTEAARAAGLDQNLPEIGFRIVTKGQDVFILGNDTPDGQEKWTSMARQGTLLGAYDFLEKVANVRWLMPTDLGEDIPQTGKLAVPEMDVLETPSIRDRYLIIALRDQARPLWELWKTRNKVDVRANGAGINWSHSFNSNPPNEFLRLHPDFMAMRKDGSFVQVPYPGMSGVMYCLSNPRLHEAFADGLIAGFDKYPKLYSASMSPDEGYETWCQCPECVKKFLEIPARWKDMGVHSPQKTALVLNFYNEVAKRVRAKHPDRVLGGFIYQDYLVPLDQSIKMEPNIIFGIAVNSGYGFKFYQPARMKIMEDFFTEWAKYGSPLGYYSYDTWMRDWFGLPLPPGLDLMKWSFPMYKKNNVAMLQYVGEEAWGYGAVHNYLAAKMMWNTSADVDALYNEFLTRAYGPEAGAVMDRLYKLVDESLKAYVRSVSYPDHEIDYALAKGIYGGIYPEIERLYFEALSKARTEPQRQRLELFGENLVFANYNMRKAGLLPEAEAAKSPLYRSDEEIQKLAKATATGIATINIPEWLSIYKRYDGKMPVLSVGWKPR